MRVHPLAYRFGVAFPLVAFLLVFRLTAHRFERNVTVSNPGSTVLTDLDVLIEYDSESSIGKGQLLPNCHDIRFYDVSMAPLQYWVESGCGTKRTMIWVRLPKLSSHSFVVRMRYGDRTLENGGQSFFSRFHHLSRSPCDEASEWAVADDVFQELHTSCSDDLCDSRLGGFVVDEDRIAERTLGTLLDPNYHYHKSDTIEPIILLDVVTTTVLIPDPKLGSEMVQQAVAQTGGSFSSPEVMNSTHVHRTFMIYHAETNASCSYQGVARSHVSLCRSDSVLGCEPLVSQIVVGFPNASDVPNDWIIQDWMLDSYVSLTDDDELIGTWEEATCNHTHTLSGAFDIHGSFFSTPGSVPWPIPSGMCEPGSGNVLEAGKIHQHWPILGQTLPMADGEMWHPTHFTMTFASPPEEEEKMSFVAGMTAISSLAPPLGWENYVGQDVLELEVPDLGVVHVRATGAAEAGKFFDGAHSHPGHDPATIRWHSDMQAAKVVVEDCEAGTDVEVMVNITKSMPAFLGSDALHSHELEVVDENAFASNVEGLFLETQELDLGSGQLPSLLLQLVRRKSSLPTSIGKEISLEGPMPCFGKSEDDACGGPTKGSCSEYDVCACLDGVHGEMCQEKIGEHGRYVSDEAVDVPYYVPVSVIGTKLDALRAATDVTYAASEMGVVSSESDGRYMSFPCAVVLDSVAPPSAILIDSMSCAFRLATGLLADTFRVVSGFPSFDSSIDRSLLLQPLSAPASSSASSLVPVSVLPPSSSLLWIAGAVVGPAVVLLFVVIVPIAIVILCCIFVVSRRQRTILDKANELEDLDIVLEEREAEKSRPVGSGSISIDKSMFEVEFKDVELVKVLGKGGSSSVVYLASWRGQAVAFKMLQVIGRGPGSSTSFSTENDDILLEFSKEVSIMASVTHPFILRFYGAALQAPRIGFVMEFCPFGDLDRFLQKQAAINNGVQYALTEKVRMMREVSSACGYLHELKIIHRDIKPQNVLVAEDKSTRLMDFGLSRITTDWGESSKLTSRIGTSIYMSPEITLAKRYTGKTDVFSFGVMLYVCLTQRWSPYGSEVRPEFAVSQDDSYRPKLSDVNLPPKLIALMTSCWDGDPDARPEFSEVSTILSDISSEELEAIEEVVPSEKTRAEDASGDSSAGGQKPVSASRRRGEVTEKWKELMARVRQESSETGDDDEIPDILSLLGRSDEILDRMVASLSTTEDESSD